MCLLRKVLTGLVFCQLASSAVLPSGLGKLEVERIVATIGQAAATKVLRSAESYPTLFPGIKVGLEINMMAGEDLQSFGQANGNVPGLLPMPRIYLAKSLPLNFELIVSFFPTDAVNTLSGIGGILKYTYLQEKDKPLSAAGYLGHTRVSGFESSYSGYDWEVGSYVSRDFVRFRPYAGAGLLFAHGTVTQDLTRGTNQSWQATIHSFIGIEYQSVLLLTGQLDFMNLSPRASVLIGKKF